MNKETAVQVSDTTKLNSSTNAKYKRKHSSDRVSNRYDFSGKVLSSHLHHQFASSVNGNSANNGNTDIVKRFEYDHRGRVLKVYQKINGGIDKQLSFNEYNELGQLQKTTLGSSLESLEYTYNL